MGHSVHLVSLTTDYTLNNNK